MQLLPHQQNVDVLRKLASEGVNLLATSQFGLLVERFGYARSMGRNPVDAVKLDFAEALRAAEGKKLLQVRANVLSVVFYEDNSSCLRAAIDCAIPTQSGRNIWVSFVVSGTGTEQFISLEDICAEPEPDLPAPDC